MCVGGGGLQMLISVETYITCDFQGRWEGADPYSPSGYVHVGRCKNIRVYGLFLHIWLNNCSLKDTGHHIN